MGYSFKGFPPIEDLTETSANIDVFTVPASHSYLIKNLEIFLGATNSTATTAKVQVSENTGTTFYDVTGVFTTGATTGNTKMVSLAIPYSSVSDNAAPSATSSSRTASPAFHNMILSAGQVLRVVKTGSSSGGSDPICRVFCSVIDYV